MRILSSDIGGTNARFAFFTLGAGSLSMRGAQSFSAKGTSFAELLEKALEGAPKGFAPETLEAVCVAAAGPEENGAIRLTNTDITVDARVIQEAFPAALPLVINDFYAQAMAAVCPEAQEGMVRIKAGAPKGGAIAVLGAGTGFGTAYVRPGPDPEVTATEFGHIPFPFKESEEKILSFITRRAGRAPIFDDVVTGSGLASLYAYFTGREDAPENFTARPGFKESEASRLFSVFYARALRSVLFASLAKSAVITGGVARKNPFFLTSEAFKESFYEAGPDHRLYLSGVEILHNQLKGSGLYGAAHYARLALAREGKIR